jgi:hypothetical protein
MQLPLARNRTRHGADIRIVSATGAICRSREEVRPFAISSPVHGLYAIIVASAGENVYSPAQGSGKRKGCGN